MQIISKIALGVAIGVISLSACKGKNKAIDLKSFDDKAYFESLRNEAYKSKTSEQTDIATLSNLLPESLNLTYDSISYSEKSGATTLSNVNLTMQDSDTGINIESLILWEVNEAAISDRLSGKNLESDLHLIGRLEASNLSIVGLESALKPIIDASNDLNSKIIEETLGGDSNLSDTLSGQSIDNYDISLRSFIVTDVKMHPWVLNLTQGPFGEDETTSTANELWNSFQKIAALSHAFSYDNMAAYDGIFKIAMTQDNLPVSFDMNIGLLGYKGYARGDVEYVVARDMKYLMDMVTPIDGNSNTATSMKTMTSTDSYTYENMYLSQLMKHLAIGKMPDRDMTDFMSLGVWQGRSTQMSVNDQTLYSLDRFKLDMSEFHGLFPEILDVEIDNLKYNLTGFMSWFNSLGEDLQLPVDQKAAMQELFVDVTEVLNSHDMTEPSFDFQFGMHWKAETGVSDLGYGFGIDGIGRFKSHFEGIMPSYDAVMGVLPEDLNDFEQSALESLFEETISFKRFSNEWHDEDFDKLLALIIDFAKMTPDNPQAAMLSNATPSQIRELVAGGLSLSGAQIAQQFPPAIEHVNTIADFFAEGGSLKIDFEAQSPLSLQDIDNLSPQIMADPDKFEKFFKLHVVRETRE